MQATALNTGPSPVWSERIRLNSAKPASKRPRCSAVRFCSGAPNFVPTVSGAERTPRDRATVSFEGITQIAAAIAMTATKRRRLNARLNPICLLYGAPSRFVKEQHDLQRAHVGL